MDVWTYGECCGWYRAGLSVEGVRPPLKARLRLPVLAPETVPLLAGVPLFEYGVLLFAEFAQHELDRLEVHLAARRYVVLNADIAGTEFACTFIGSCTRVLNRTNEVVKV